MYGYLEKGIQTPMARGRSTYRGNSLIRNRHPVGPYRRPMPRVLGGSYGGGRFLVDKMPLYAEGPVVALGVGSFLMSEVSVVDTTLSQITFHPATFDYVENASPGESSLADTQRPSHAAGPNLFLCIQNCRMCVEWKMHLVFAGIVPVGYP